MNKTLPISDEIGNLYELKRPIVDDLKLKYAGLVTTFIWKVPLKILFIVFGQISLHSGRYIEVFSLISFLIGINFYILNISRYFVIVDIFQIGFIVIILYLYFEWIKNKKDTYIFLIFFIFSFINQQSWSYDIFFSFYNFMVFVFIGYKKSL